MSSEPHRASVGFIRYLHGNGVQLDTEAAAWYLGCAADVAYTEYHLVGAQPIIEKQRLTELNEVTVATGQQVEEDNAIQYQVRSPSSTRRAVREELNARRQGSARDSHAIFH